MFETLVSVIGSHWALSTYVSVMVLNESAILASFCLAAGDVVGKFPTIVLVSILGLLTNDLILFAIARIGSVHVPNSGVAPKSVLGRFMTRNAFCSLLFIKFLFGIRLFLTMYLVVKSRMPLGKFMLYDLFGSFLYVGVIGTLGWMIGRGSTGVLDAYQQVVRVVVIVMISFIVTHALAFLFRGRCKPIDPVA